MLIYLMIMGCTWAMHALARKSKVGHRCWRCLGVGFDYGKLLRAIILAGIIINFFVAYREVRQFVFIQGLYVTITTVCLVNLTDQLVVMLWSFTCTCSIFVPYAVTDLISTYRSLSFSGLILLFPPICLVFGLTVTKYLLYSSTHQSLASAVCVCVESTANTSGISIFGIRRLWQRGKDSISAQQ